MYFISYHVLVAMTFTSWLQFLFPILKKKKYIQLYTTLHFWNLGYQQASCVIILLCTLTYLLMTGKTVSSMDHPGSGVTLSSAVFRYCDLRSPHWQLSPTSKLSSSRNNLVPDLQPLQFAAWHISLNHLRRSVKASASQTHPPAWESRQLKMWSPFTPAAPAKEAVAFSSGGNRQILVTAAQVATTGTARL